MVRPLGVSGAVVIEASAWADDNQWVLDLAKEHSIIVGVVGHLEPGKEGFRQNLARFRSNSLFRGIRLGSKAIEAGMGSPEFVEGLRELAEDGLMLDAIGNPSMLSSLLSLSDRIPRLRVVINHMPGEPVGWQDREESRAALRELGARPEVYSKVSGVLQNVNGKVAENLEAYRSDLDRIWELFGENRVMYGSNWPVSDRLAGYQSVLRVMREYVEPKGSTAYAKFFNENARHCYGVSLRAR
jgi:predicted TIM-barrel fold metal-dependent hydrolase